MQQLQLFTPPEPKRRRSQRGAELVEFALIFPVLMLFLIAALSLLWLGFMKVAAAQSAKEAARYASVPVACSGSLGAPLVDVPTSITVPNTLPDGSPIPQPPDLKTIETMLPDTTTSSIAPPALPAGGALGSEVSPKMELASATHQIGPVTTLITTVTTIQNTVTSLLPTTTTAAPTTTTTAAPTTTTSITLPSTTVTIPSTTTLTTTPKKCSPDFRTYPNRGQVAHLVDQRVPLSLWHLDENNFDIVYTYNDPSCTDPDQAHRNPDDQATCHTPRPNDPPSNAKVNVKVTQQLTGPLGVFAGIFNGGSTITADAGGETRGE